MKTKEPDGRTDRYGAGYAGLPDVFEGKRGCEDGAGGNRRQQPVVKFGSRSFLPQGVYAHKTAFVI
jgi:hypothetical protein